MKEGAGRRQDLRAGRPKKVYVDQPKTVEAFRLSGLIMNRSTQILIAIATLGAVVSFALTMAMVYRENTVVLSISTGVLGSIIGALIYTIFSNMLFGSSLTIEEVRKCNIGLSSLLEGLSAIGVDYIADRRFFGDSFWEKQIKEVARNSNKASELVLLGRTLDNWRKGNFREIFSQAIVSVIQKGGNVEIVSLKPDGHAANFLTQATGKDMSRMTNSFDAFLKDNIMSRLSLEEKKRLSRRYIQELQPPFTLFKSDGLLWISPYVSTRNTESNIAMTIKRKSSLATLILDDYQEIKSNHTVVISDIEYGDSANGPAQGIAQ